MKKIRLMDFKKKIKLNNGKCFDCSAIQIRSIKSWQGKTKSSNTLEDMDYTEEASLSSVYY